MTNHSDDIERAGARRVEAERVLAQATDDLRAAVLAAVADGVPVARAARMGQVSRVSVHRWIAESESAEK
ncbi:helix-turn-helix domain-containing protein [Agromyces sp. NPDC058104]|uniref:helix-turn-helix domain-containing protein n=1 Tax=Agromyces sp. NPDC058104 TaxID=3346342 RepID=UPI0036DCA01D